MPQGVDRGTKEGTFLARIPVGAPLITDVLRQGIVQPSDKITAPTLIGPIGSFTQDPSGLVFVSLRDEDGTLRGDGAPRLEGRN